MSLTPEAKKLLAETIRGTQQDPEKGLRARLLCVAYAPGMPLLALQDSAGATTRVAARFDTRGFHDLQAVKICARRADSMRLWPQAA